jgi:uncharacterized protein
MGVVRYGESLNVLVAVKGHPFQRDAFAAIFDDMPGVSATFVDQPAAAHLLSLEGLAPYQALVLYDMPGLDFLSTEPPRFVPPPQGLRGALEAVLDAGKGVVALHHAIAGWPTEEWYAELLGGRFLYKAGVLRGAARPDSGYRHDVNHTVSVVQDHPITAGLPASFPLTDELYLFEVFEDQVEPLLRSSAAFTQDQFYSATLAVNGQMFSNEGWEHAPGSNLVGWVKRARRSPLAYLQPGDGPATYADANYRRLVENAIRWAASAEALAWARASGCASQ